MKADYFAKEKKKAAAGGPDGRENYFLGRAENKT